jgi:hypothetical protein
VLQALDRWEERLEAVFEGRPFDSLDAALADTVAEFPVHIQPFRDMIDGMRMDLVKSRYQTYDELYEYCYRVAGTVALMTTPVMGVDPAYKVRVRVGHPGCRGCRSRAQGGGGCLWSTLPLAGGGAPAGAPGRQRAGAPR